MNGSLFTVYTKEMRAKKWTTQKGLAWLADHDSKAKRKLKGRYYSAFSSILA